MFREFYVNFVTMKLKKISRCYLYHIVAMLVMIVGGGRGIYAQVNAEQVTQIGRNVLSMDDYMLAIYYFNQAIKAKGYLPEPYYLRALAKMNLDDLKGAEEDCTSAIRIKKFYTDAYKLRGFTRLRLGKDSLALEDFKTGLLDNPVDRDLLFYKAIAEGELKRYDVADSTFSYLLKVNPKFYEALTSRAAMRLERGDTAGCLADIEKTLAISKAQVNAYAMRADIMQARGNWQEAIEAVDEIVRLHPENPDLYINRAFFKYKNDDYYGAMADYNEAIHVDPFNSAALFNRALLHYEVMELDKAADDFSRVLDLDGANFHARYNRALIYLTKHQYAKAEADIRAILQKYPRFYPAYYALAQARQGQGDLRGAVQNSQKADELVRRYVANPERNPLDRPTVAPVANNRSKTDEEESEEEIMNRFNQLVTSSMTEEKELSFSDRYKGKVQDRETSLALEPMFSLSLNAPEQSLKAISNYFKELGELNSHNYISERIYLVEEERQLTTSEIEHAFALADKFTAAVQSSHQRAVDYLGRGVVYTMLRNYEAALADFDKALELMPDFTVALMGKGYVLTKLQASGKEVSAFNIVETYNKALQLNPNLVYAWFNEGNIYYDNGNYAMAEQCYDEALRLYPELGPALYNRGLSRMQQGRKNEAFDDFSKAGEQGVLQGYRVMKSLQ